MVRPVWRLIGLGCATLAAASCGSEELELRALSARSEASEPGPLPTPNEPAPAAGAGASDSGVVTPGRDGVLGPVSQQPGIFEPPAAPGAEPTGEKGCKKIDFLFVIDDSSSMDDEQANLARSFPGFIDIMQQVLDVDDFHVMVVSTSGESEEADEPTLDPSECEEIQGAGRRRNTDGEDCGIAGGLPFMTSAQPNLEDTFSCVARVGTDGSAVEEPMDAVVAATSAELNGDGRCNAGFMRDDAILVVTVITDEEDTASRGEPEDWRERLLGVKGGNEDALVVLGLVGDNNVEGGLLGGPCSLLDADGSPRLQQFVDSVGGVLGSVCSPDYSSFFQTAVGSIDSACEDFVPPPIY